MTQENKEETLELPTNKVDAADDGGADDSEEKEVITHTMMEYLHPENKYAVITKRWVWFTLYSLPFYLVSLFFAVYGVDQYTDVEGRIKCAGRFQTLPYADSQNVYQLGLALTVIYHAIEFMRQLAVASAALVGYNLMWIYYVLSINVVFGVVALVIALAARLGADGQLCADAQPNRAMYMILQFIPLVLMIVQSFHVLIYMRYKGVDWCNEVINEESEDEDDD